MKKHLFLFASVLAFTSCKHEREIPPGNFVVVAVGDSVTFGEKNTLNNTPNDFAMRALDTTATLIKLAYRGENSGQFYQNHRQELLDSLANVPVNHQTMLVLWFGLNDLNAAPKEQALTNILKVARWAHDTAHVAQVLILPIFNRTDKWGFTRESNNSESHHFNESRLWLNSKLHSRAGAWPWARVASESDSPAMYADTYPADTKRCADNVHPTDEGAKDEGEGTIAHGIASFGQIKLK